MQLEELHVHLYDFLGLVDDICKKENVRYFLTAGTELGAVREHGFIPWDDDVDIMVLREDYDAFKAAMQKHLPEHYAFLEPEDVMPKFYDFVPRIVDKDIVIREETEADRFYDAYRNHLCIDIFIFEKGPDNPIAQKMLVIMSKCIYGMAMSKRHGIDYDKRSLGEKIVVFLFSLLGHLFSAKQIMRFWKKLTQKYNRMETAYRYPANFIPRDMASNVGYAGGVKNVEVAVWSVSGGQDDLVWYSMRNATSNTWLSNVIIANHKSKGAYLAHVYITDSNGNKRMIGQTSFLVP